MTIILVSVYIAAFFLIAKLFSKREGYYSTVVIFGLAAYIYYIGIPFEMALLNLDTIEGSGVKLMLTASQLNQIVGMGIIAFLSFSIGYYFSGFNPFKNSLVPPKASPRRSIRFSVIFLGVLSLVVIPIFFRNLILAVSTYEGAIAAIYHNPLFSLLIIYVAIVISLISTIVIRKGKFRNFVIGLGLVSTIVLYGIYSSDKTVMLIGLLALGAVFIKLKLNRKWIFLPLIILTAFLGVFLGIIFNIYIRGSGQVPMDEFFRRRLGLRRFDPLGPMLSLEHVLSNRIALKYGTTYIDVFSLIIPKVFWKDRPLDLSEEFARETMPNWSPGQGRGYSLLAEAYLNFSWAGAFIQYFVIGLLWGWFWKTLRRLFYWHYSPLLWQGLYITLGYFLLIIMHRGPAAGLFKSMILCNALFVLFAIYFDFSMLRKPKPKVV